MSTIILTGSPKGSSKQCNSNILAKAFVSQMETPCEIKHIAKSDPKQLAQDIKAYDQIIIILPLYIHAMPSITMKFIECMEAANGNQTLGFIVQAGFIETAQERYVKAYFEDLAKQLNYRYLGTVCKGEAAAIYMYPKLFKKVIERVAQLGKRYEETGGFDKEIVAMLGKPYELSKKQAKKFEFFNKIGLNNIGWHSNLRKNKAMDKRLDKPFL